MQALGNRDTTARQRCTTAAHRLAQKTRLSCGAGGMYGSVEHLSTWSSVRNGYPSCALETMPCWGEKSVAQSLLACMGLPRRTGSTCDRCPSRGQPGMTGGKEDKERPLVQEPAGCVMASFLMPTHRKYIMTVHLSLQGQFSLRKKLWFFLPMEKGWNPTVLKRRAQHTRK